MLLLLRSKNKSENVFYLAEIAIFLVRCIVVKKRDKLIVFALILTAIFSAIERNKSAALEQKNLEELNLKMQAFANQVEAWDELNSLSLSNLVKQPDIISMKPELQKPVLENMVKTYKHLYLAHTVDLTGNNVARSDSNAPKYYGNRDWFSGALMGIEINRQPVIGFTNNRPALCVGAPIKNKKQVILGATTICTDLGALAEKIGNINFGQTGYLMVVDRTGKLLLHPNSALLGGKKLKDFSDYPPVKYLLEGRSGEFNFTDERHQNWVSFGTSLENGWRVVVVVTSNEISPNDNLFRLLVIVAITLSAVLVWSLKDSLKAQKIPNHSSPLSLGEQEKLKQNPQVMTAVTVEPLTPPLPPQKTGKHSRSYLGRERAILIVDSDRSNQKFCETILNTLGFKTAIANDGESGYNLAQSHQFDLIFTNLLLPICCGKRMVSRLRQIPRYSSTPIIGITANIAAIKNTKNYLLGFTDFLAEPLDRNQLVSKLAGHLSLSWKFSNPRVITFPDRKIPPRKINI